MISAVDRSGPQLSFYNLVELHVLSSIRIKNVKISAVRRAIEYLEKRLNSKHPLLERQMLTDGKDLFIEQYGNLMAISKGGQLALKEILEIYLDRIDRNSHGIPIRLFPFTRNLREPRPESPRSIVINPTIRFGAPCIAGTRIPTYIIAERYAAGDSFQSLAADYGRSTEEIEEAIRYERRVAS